MLDDIPTYLILKKYKKVSIMNTRVLVTDGNNRACLAITRSLGMVGAEILVGEKTSHSLAGSSKYCSQRVKYPDPNFNPLTFEEYIIDLVSKKKIDVVIPVSEITTILVTKLKDKLPERCSVPFPDSLTVESAADKKNVINLSRKLGVPVPNTIVLDKKESLDVLEDLTMNAKFPIVIKPYKSRILHGNEWKSTKVDYAKDVIELDRKMKKLPDYAFPILLQEKIEGAGVGIFVCMHNKKEVAHFCHIRIREKPPSGGVSVLRKSIPADPVLLSQSIELLKEIGWEGVAMVEFKKDDKNNDYKIMEINGRFWGSLQLAIDSKVNFPLKAMEIARKERVGRIKNYKLNVNTRWLLGDIDALISVLKQNNENQFLPEKYFGKKKYLFDFFKTNNRSTHFEVLRLNDIKPFAYEIKLWIRNIIKR